MKNPVGYCQECKKMVYANGAKFKDEDGIIEKVWHISCLKNKKNTLKTLIQSIKEAK